MLTWIALGALAVAAVSLLLSIWSLARTRASKRRAAARRQALEAMGDDDGQISALSTQIEGLARRLERNEALGQRAIQHIGVVRYNPFADTGSNQSFVLAFLDARGDGFVLSSLHSRQQTRVFLKPVSGGAAETALSEEETEAIRRATAGR